MKWLEKLKEYIEDKKITNVELAKICGMTPTGVKDALIKGSFKFNVMIYLLKHYNINYYDFTKEDTNIISEAEAEYGKSHINREDLEIIINTLNKTHEDQIIQYKDTIQILKSQLSYMQNKKGECMEGEDSMVG